MAGSGCHRGLPTVPGRFMCVRKVEERGSGGIVGTACQRPSTSSLRCSLQSVPKRVSRPATVTTVTEKSTRSWHCAEPMPYPGRDHHCFLLQLLPVSLLKPAVGRCECGAEQRMLESTVRRPGDVCVHTANAWQSGVRFVIPFGFHGNRNPNAL